MGCPRIKFFLIILTLFLCNTSSFAQVIFNEPPKYQINLSDSVFFDINEKRNLISLNGKWKVSPNEEDAQSVSVNIPSIFKGDAELIFTRNFSLSQNLINRNKLKLFFMGINYSADISVNNIIIYRHTGGEYPFHLDLPKDVLTSEKDNILSVKVFYKLDSKNTIPLKQRFLFPQNFGGIIKDIYIHLTPNVSVADFSCRYNLDDSKNTARLNFYTRIENKDFKNIFDSTQTTTDFAYRIKLISPDGNTTNILQDEKFSLLPNKEKNFNGSYELKSPVLWSPASPQYYMLQIEIVRDDILVDKTLRRISFYSLVSGKDSLTFNGQKFSLDGITYIPAFYDYGNLTSFEKMEKDIRIIKQTGFNVIRFAKSVPHPYYLTLCERYGLLAFIELPMNGMPGALAEDNNFVERTKNYLTNFLKVYKDYSSVAAIGAGGGYLSELGTHQTVLNQLISHIKKTTGKLTYASFANYVIKPVDNCDLYGLEFYNHQPSEFTNKIQTLIDEFGSGKIFISEATYPVYAGNSDGYLNEHSYEAQAKYFDELLQYCESMQLPGYFLNTMFDYRGDYSSLTSGYNKESIYNIGILGEDRRTDRISYKVISNRLHNSEKVTIPIGTKKDDAPMVLNIFGLVLALAIGIMVNSGRKFREDASRALLRPYNFYADVRDQRIISGYHSVFLALIVSSVSGLLLTNLLFYFKDSIMIEKILLAFGSPGLIKTFGYLAWNPVSALLWLTLVSGAALILLTVVIKLASFFVRNRVYLSSVFFTVAWSYLPLVLLIPVGIVLYRLLSAEVANIYIYVALILFTIWIFYRLIKGIYVIFDVNPGSVYFYSAIAVLLIAGFVVVYYEINNSVIQYLGFVFDQYNIIH
ncbi:MAG: hypothetical protein IPM56_00085 [Ignavibacteriales bacterium]|nr:MAG: hypothetical protein IPM56_00085 [Ignavibacteriales bacterium]